MIYENDMPDIPAKNTITISSKGSIVVNGVELNRLSETDYRFKPNGITDNREWWNKSKALIDSCMSRSEARRMARFLTQKQPSLSN